MSNQVLYHVYDDGDNKYLIPLDEWEVVSNIIATNDTDAIDDILDNYFRLEGQEYAVVLIND